jgi:hypothetical protein
MVNRRRGEVEAILDGRPHTLCLTLGALAELESALAEKDLMALARRFSAGGLSAGDTIRVIGAGLRGAGNDIDDASVARMRADGGATGFVAIVAELLAATFGGADDRDVPLA